MTRSYEHKTQTPSPIIQKQMPSIINIQKSPIKHHARFSPCPSMSMFARAGVFPATATASFTKPGKSCLTPLTFASSIQVRKKYRNPPTSSALLATPRSAGWSSLIVSSYKQPSTSMANTRGRRQGRDEERERKKGPQKKRSTKEALRDIESSYLALP
jgi:hypothetical protein